MVFDVKLALTGCLCVCAGGMLLAELWPRDRSAPVREEELAEVVYVCRDTQAIFTGRARETPAIHPQTGARTLMPGVYCPRCEEWRPSLALEDLQRNPAAAVCPKFKCPMLREGPIPADAVSL
jgi:hypothetical protein